MPTCVGRLTIDITSYMKYYTIKLYNSSGVCIWYTDCNTWNDNLKYRSDIYTLDLSATTYYLRITGYERYDDSSAWGKSTGNYKLITSFDEACDLEFDTIVEPNNDFSNAYKVPFESIEQGQIAIDDGYDICRFSLKKTTDLGMVVISYMNYYTLEIYNSGGERVWYDDYNEKNQNVEFREDKLRVSLDAETYYLKISGYKSANSTSTASTGEYYMYLWVMDSVQDASVSKIKTQTYKNAYIKPNVKVIYKKKTLKEGVDYKLSYENNYNTGKATVIITGIGDYTGTKRVSFKIIPKTPKIEKAYNSTKGTGYMVWTKDYGIDGYEIYQSSEKNKGYTFRYSSSDYNYNAVEMFKLKKGRTYYFKVRSYKLVDGKKYYSKFSSPKAIKIKK